MAASPQTGARLRLVGRYALKEELASGGMATVSLGKLRGPVGFSPVVAIKTLHPHYAKEPEFVRMFLDEARLAARVRHANIVPVIDVQDESGQLMLVMEYIHGESLGRLLGAGARERRLVPLAVVSAILCDVLHGLHAAHEAKGELGEPLGIVHRDVSPPNVLVGVDGVARVFDFGIAKAAGRITMTRDGQVKGKFAYMAPEQLRGEDVNRQADVYSAAVVLWETIASERLFKATSEGNVVTQALFAPVRPPSEVRADVPEALDAVVLRGLARERSQRFATAKEMALALSSIVPPAGPPQVAEWVESLAVDVLEKRKRLIASLEAEMAFVPEDGGEGPGQSGMRSTASPRLDAAAVATDTPAPKPRRTTPLLVAAALAMGGLGVWLGLHLRSNEAPATAAARTAASDSGSAVASSAPPPSPETAASTSAANDTAPAPSATPASSTSAPKLAQAPDRPRPFGKRSTPVVSSGRPPARCARYGADGTIQFDTNCLREAQRTP